MRVDADQHHLQLRAHVRWQLAFQFAQLRQGGGADVRAEGVAEEQYVPAAFQAGGVEGLAVLVLELQRGHAARLREHDDTGIQQHRRIELLLRGEHLVDGQA
ncbi:hypothetical protein D3C80_1760370 [compost metagenome]